VLTAAQVVPVLIQDAPAVVLHLAGKVLNIKMLGWEPFAETEALLFHQLFPQLAPKAEVAALHSKIASQ